MPWAASASWKAARWSGSSSAITPSKSKTSARGPRGMGASYSRAGRRWPTTARLHRIPGLHEDDLPPTAVERADRRSGAPRVAAHMDHFMGFDQLLRLFLARDATLRLYGPAGL